MKQRFILLWRRQRHRRSYVCKGFGSFSAQYWARRFELRFNGYFEKVQKTHKRLTATGAVQITSEHKFLFMISICSSQCNYSVKLQRFYCFISFAQNADIHTSGKRRNSTIDPNGKTVVWIINDQLSTSRCIKIVIIFQQFVFNIEMKGSVWLFQQIGTIIRSSHDSKWQACMRETDAARSWQAGHGKPWTIKISF